MILNVRKHLHSLLLMAKTIIDTNEVVVYRVIMYANSLLIVSAHRVRTVIHRDHHYQGTIYRNAQLRYKQIVYCTLWEECKQTQCPHRSWRERTKVLVWFYSPTKNKLIYQVRANTYSTPCALFPQKRCVAHDFFILISSHWWLQYTDLTLQIWRFLVYIFLESIYISRCLALRFKKGSIPIILKKCCLKRFTYTLW